MTISLTWVMIVFLSHFVYKFYKIIIDDPDMLKPYLKGQAIGFLVTVILVVFFNAIFGK